MIIIDICQVKHAVDDGWSLFDDNDNGWSLFDDYDDGWSLFDDNDDGWSLFDDYDDGWSLCDDGWSLFDDNDDGWSLFDDNDCYFTGFDTLAMMGVLRDEESGICRLGRVGSATVASQVSVLYPPDSGKPGCHWLTGTPNPNRSVFKPFVFTADVTVPSLTASPTFQDDPAKTRPRFERLVDRAHPLYVAHRRINPLDDNFQHEPLRALLRGLEEGCVREVGEFMAQYDTSRENELHGLFADVVETEMKFYPTKQ